MNQILQQSRKSSHDLKYYERKIQQFEREYAPEAAAWLIAELGSQSPSTVVTMQDIERDYAHYSKLLVQDPQLTEFARVYAHRLLPYLQAPFPLPSGDIIQGPWTGAYKIGHFTICGVTTETATGKRVLDIGSNAGFDTFYLATLGPREVIGIEPTALFYYQSLFLWAMYNCPNLSFRKVGWQESTSAGLGVFDIVNCQGILYHEPNPMQLIDILFDLLVPGGTLVLETHISLGDDQIARFIAGPFWGDMSWFWVPTLKTVEAMLRVRGFETITVRDSFTVDSKNPEDPERTVEGEPAGGRAFITAMKPAGRVYAPKYGLR